MYILKTAISGISKTLHIDSDIYIASILIAVKCFQVGVAKSIARHFNLAKAKNKKETIDSTLTHRRPSTRD